MGSGVGAAVGWVKIDGGAWSGWLLRKGCKARHCDEDQARGDMDRGGVQEIEGSRFDCKWKNFGWSRIGLALLDSPPVAVKLQRMATRR